jgi:hypothetical protein
MKGWFFAMPYVSAEASFRKRAVVAGAGRHDRRFQKARVPHATQTSADREALGVATLHVANLQKEDVAELQETATASAGLLAEVLHELPMVSGRSVDRPIHGLVVRDAIVGWALVDLASTSRLYGTDGQRGDQARLEHPHMTDAQIEAAWDQLADQFGL